jgi:capsular polysaccharide biosynthesis protein
MDAMISIADSEGLAVQTQEDIDQSYPANGIELEDLKSAVDISTSGDTILISATIDNPEYAAVIANTWAQNAVTAINYAYTEEQLPSEIMVSLEPARAEYEQAQTDLESFLKENQVDVLEKQIDETSTLLDELVQDRTWKIAYNVQRKQKMEQVINQAEILKELLRNRDTSLAAGVADALAVLRLRAEAFGALEIESGVLSSSGSGTSSSKPSQETIVMSPSQPDMVFNVQITELSESLEAGQNYQKDLDGIIDHAQEEKQKAETELLELAQQSLDVGNDELFTATSTRLRDLQSELEAETAYLAELTSMRDLSLEVYQALIRKEAEVRNNLQTSSTVTLASPAVPPGEPTSRGVLRNTAIGAVLGFFVSTIWILGGVWFRGLEVAEEDNQETQ